MVKLSHYRPTQAPRPPGGEASMIFRQSAHKVCTVASPTHQPPLLPGKIPGTHFYWRLTWPQGHSPAAIIKPMKNLKDPIGNPTSSLPACSYSLNMTLCMWPPCLSIHCCIRNGKAVITRCNISSGFPWIHAWIRCFKPSLLAGLFNMLCFWGNPESNNLVLQDRASGPARCARNTWWFSKF